MIELIKYVVGRFAEKPDEVEYDIVDDGKNVSVTITLSDSDMGKVMGTATKALAGKAEGRMISAMVKKLL